MREVNGKQSGTILRKNISRIERSKVSVKKTEREMREYYQSALRLEPQLLIDFLIKEILLFDDRVEIYFNSPIKNSPDNDSQGFSFYRGIVHRTFKDPHKSDITRITLEVIMRV